MNAYKLSAKQQDRVRFRLTSLQYMKIDHLMWKFCKVRPVVDAKSDPIIPVSARAYYNPTKCGCKGMRISALGAIRRLQDKGVNWQKELEITFDKEKMVKA